MTVPSWHHQWTQGDLFPSAVLLFIFMGWIAKCYCVNLLSNLSSHHEWPHWREDCIPMNRLPCVIESGARQTSKKCCGQWRSQIVSIFGRTNFFGFNITIEHNNRFSATQKVDCAKAGSPFQKKLMRHLHHKIRILKMGKIRNNTSCKVIRLWNHIIQKPHVSLCYKLCLR